jgi:hypothetical protein
MAQNLKLMSVRLDPDTVEKIEKWVDNHRYWKRNQVINNILTCVMNDFGDKAIYDMARRGFYRKNEVKASYEITDLLKPDVK